MSDFNCEQEQEKQQQERQERQEDLNEEAKLALVGERVEVSSLLPAYQNNPGSFQQGIRLLASSFGSMRRVHGDGNCFYRALLFSYLEELLERLQSSCEARKEEGKKELQRFSSLIEGSKAKLIEMGYDEFVFEMFYDEFVELLATFLPADGDNGFNLPAVTASSLLQNFIGQQADSYTWYMRLLTAGYLIQHHERFSPFIMAEESTTSSSLADVKVGVLLNGTQGDAVMRGYCQREVEPMGKESEQLHVTALTEVLGLQVDIEYLDGRPFDETTGLGCIHFKAESLQESCPFVLHLLYRPGHYDIIYPSE